MTMVNEVLQWILLTALGFLLLGILRQVSLMVPPAARAVPSGPAVGSSLPEEALRVIRQILPDGSLKSGALVAFVTENCPGCRRLVASLMSPDSVDSLNGQPLILVAKSPSAQFRRALEETAIPVIHDDSEKIWQACDVTATPLVLRLDYDGKVVGKEVTHRVHSIEVASSSRC
jgi:hypothetical protein